MSLIERNKALDRFANYGSEGCMCGPQATPAIDCPIHHPIVEFERMDDLLRGVVKALEDIRDAVRTAAVMSRAAEYAERRAVEALTTLQGGQ